MFGMGLQELLVVLVIVLLLFGAKRLPGIARALGRAVREFKHPFHEPEEKPGEETKKIEEEKRED